MVEAKFISQKKRFTGITEFKDKLVGKKAVICCSGLSLKEYDDSSIPENWVRVAVNEGIRKIADTADFWVLSDRAIVTEYSALCKDHTTILAMHQSAHLINRYSKVPDIYTMNSMSMPPKDYGNGYEFFSRGTVMIGAIEMARYMGIKEFYIFGLDCYRTPEQYYYDGRTPENTSERNPVRSHNGWMRKGWEYKDGILIAPRLARMIEVLDIVKDSGLWEDSKLYCVNSPRTQQTAIPPMTLEELSDIIKEESREKHPTLIQRGLKNAESLLASKSDDNTTDIIEVKEGNDA